ncbi:hypothetical protein NXY46_29560 [Bacteroides ovatus]|nr:hypothetical protein [Bacteroides ovatus]
MTRQVGPLEMYRWNADGSLAKVVRADKRECGSSHTTRFRAQALPAASDDSDAVDVEFQNVRVLNSVEAAQGILRHGGQVEHGHGTPRHDGMVSRRGVVRTGGNDKGRQVLSILTGQLWNADGGIRCRGQRGGEPGALTWTGTSSRNRENANGTRSCPSGHGYDCETGLAYNRFKKYSPKMGMYAPEKIRLDWLAEYSTCLATSATRT